MSLPGKPRRAVPYGVSIATSALAISARFALAPWLNGRPGLLLALAAVMVAASCGGFGPGLLALALCLLAWNYAFIPSGHGLPPTRMSDWVLLTLFITLATAICKWGQVIVDVRRKTHRQAHMLEEVGDAVFAWEFGPNGRILYWNRGAERLYGLSAKNVAGRGIRDCLADPGEPRLTEILDALTRDGEWSGELTRSNALGKSVLAWCRMTLVRDAGTRAGDLVYEIDRDLTEKKQAEETNAWLATIVASCDEAIIGKSLAGIVLSWNAGAERLFGYAANEAIGRAITFLVPADRITEETAILERIRGGGGIDGFESVRLAKDGRGIDVSITVSPIRDPQGGLIGISNITRDITETRRAEAAIRRNTELERRIAAIADTAPGAISSLLRTSNGHISVHFASQRIADLFGISAEVLSTDFAPALANVHPEDLAGFLSAIEDASARLAPLNPKFRYAHPVKGARWIEAWASPAPEPEGGVLWHGFFADVTDFELAESARRESDRFARSVLDSILNHIAVLDEAGAILSVNHSWRASAGETAGPAAGAPGMNYLEICDSAAGAFSESATALAAGIREILAGRGAWFELECPCHTPRERRWFLARATPFVEGGPRRVVVSLQNISALKLAEEHLLSRERMLSQSQKTAHVGSWELDLNDLDDLERNPLRWSDETYRIFGYEPGSIAVSNELFTSALSPEDRLRVLAAVTESLKDRSSYQLVHPIRRANGAERIVREWGEFTAMEEGSGLKIVGTCQDITEDTLAQERLRRSEERLSLALDSAELGVWDWLLIESSIRWSPRLERMFGFGPGEFDGSAEPAFAKIHPDDRERVDRALAAASDSRRLFHEELRIVPEPGVVRWLASFGRFSYDDSGKPVRAAGIAQDITERKRSEEALRSYAARLVHLREIDSAILSARDPHEIAHKTLKDLSALMPLSTGGIVLFKNGLSLVESIAAVGVLEELHPAGRMLPGFSEDSYIRKEAREGIPIVVGDDADGPGEMPLIKTLRNRGLRSFLRVPLRDRGELIGAALLASDAGEAYTQEHVDICVEVADRLAVAIHQSVLSEELRRAKLRAEDLSRRLLKAGEDERRRISRELHDDIGQELTALKLNVKASLRDPSRAAERLEDCVAIVDQTLGRVRGMAIELRPSILDDIGLTAALKWYVDRFAQRSGLEGRFSVDPPDLRADAEIETACFRIVQEALTNIVRHAEAKRFSVELSKPAAGVRLIVRDDGKGFSVESALASASRGASLGLRGIKERAELISGTVAFHSEPGAGAEVVAEFPDPIGAHGEPARISGQ